MFKLKPKKVGSLKSMLLFWMIGSAMVLALVYNGLMEYQFRFGIEIRSKAEFEWYAYTFEKQYLQDKQTPLPSGPFFFKGLYRLG